MYFRYARIFRFNVTFPMRTVDAVPLLTPIRIVFHTPAVSLIFAQLVPILSTSWQMGRRTFLRFRPFVLALSA